MSEREMEFYRYGHRNKKIGITIEEAMRMEEAGEKVYVIRGEITEEERKRNRDGAGNN